MNSETRAARTATRNKSKPSHRQAAAVVQMLTGHLAGAGIDILAKLAPYWEPKSLRTAARLILSGAAHLDPAPEASTPAGSERSG